MSDRDLNARACLSGIEYMKELEENIGYAFKNAALFDEAMTHPSFAYGKKGKFMDNQRLEYLGDAVFELVISEYLFGLFPKEDEGFLTKMRARIVSREGLAKFASEIGLQHYMKISKGEEASGGRTRASTLADGLESLIGAIFLDSGFEAAKAVIVRVCTKDVMAISKEPDETNPKGRLQEVLQAIENESPIYVIASESGPDHQKEFQVRVEWRGAILAEGRGSNKKEAEAAAARKALSTKKWSEG